MKKNKQELRTTLGLILIYVVCMSVFESQCPEQWMERMRVIPVALVLALQVFVIYKRKDTVSIGLYRTKQVPGKETLYFIPLIILATANLWHGVVIRYDVMTMALSIIGMLLVGFVEEILFRGFLFQALMRRSVKIAIIVSTLTFGLGHGVNFLNGAEFAPTILQIIYALAIGLMLSVFAFKTGNILPCCIFHGVFNALAVFSNEEGQTMVYQVIVCVVISLIAVGYAWYMWKVTK